MQVAMKTLSSSILPLKREGAVLRFVRGSISHFARHKYEAKYPKAVDCLTKDRDALLTFFDFPAEHWDHLRTSNPIENAY